MLLWVFWVFTSLSILFTAARLFVRASVHRKFFLDDYLIILSIVRHFSGNRSPLPLRAQRNSATVEAKSYHTESLNPPSANSSARYLDMRSDLEYLGHDVR